MNVESLSLSRRGLIKGVAALGAAASLGGSFNIAEAAMPEKESTDSSEIVWGSSGHNCGGRCVSRAVVSEGRITRILTDESTHTRGGAYIDTESRNFPQTRACARCRSYRYRLYHKGRLLYPLKQTKKRGDLSGFVRISWEQALKEISEKHKAVLDKYGVDGIYQIYACGSVSSQFQGAQAGAIGKGGGHAMKAMGGVVTPMFGSYSRHQHNYFGVGYTGMDSEDPSFNAVAKHANTLVLWGDNSMSTSNPTTYGSVRAVEDMKKRNPDAKVYFIGPELVDGGITLADEWVVSKPFTDPALVAGMIYHMLDNTFDLRTGQLKPNPWLDVDYLDTLVYGFFDSPEYGLNEKTGVINAKNSNTGDRTVPAVPAGRSYCSWILGNNTAAKKYDELGNNYTASMFAATGMKRWAPCSIPAKKGSASQYKTKQDYKTPKTPAWASKITGVPEEAIKRLAEVFVKNRPVNSRWSGGQQKQADGIANLYAVESLHIITKNVGVKGSAYAWLPFKGASVKNDKGIDLSWAPKMKTYEKPSASCTAWHTAIKMGFADELMRNGYRAKYIPNWEEANKGKLKTGDGNIYWDDAGTKAMICWERDEETGKIKTFSDGKSTFYKWKGKDEGKKPVVVGLKLLYNAGGNIFVNQHENSNDSREMLEYLDLNDPKNPDTFCLVSVDNFLSATPRWSDYVLPGATFWEQDDTVTPVNITPFFTRKAINPPGEAKALWDIGIDLVKTYEKTTGQSGLLDMMLGGKNEPDTVEGIIKKRFENAPAESPISKMTWEEYRDNPYLPPLPDDDKMVTPACEGLMNKFNSMNKMQPLITKEEGNYVKTNEINQGGYGNDFANVEGAPKSPLRFQVYSPVLVWQYENRFSKWHGYLPANKRGQHNTDFEGDRLVTELPLYYAYEDYFMEAYGGKDKVDDLPFLLTTTHNRYRSHSSMAENPMLRELSHRVPGRDADGNPIEANDAGLYAVMPMFDMNKSNTIPMLESVIKPDGTVAENAKKYASYSEIWINETDGKTLLGIEDGDLVQVENPIGAVRCVARLSKRCSRGFVGLHQGCWYDPRPLPNSYGHDNVDVGGNCNTLMASQPSRIDHGNGQQSAMVKIFKVENY